MEDDSKHVFAIYSKNEVKYAQIWPDTSSSGDSDVLVAQALLDLARYQRWVRARAVQGLGFTALEAQI